MGPDDLVASTKHQMRWVWSCSESQMEALLDTMVVVCMPGLINKQRKFARPCRDPGEDHRLLAYRGLPPLSVAAWCQARPTVFRTNTRGCRYALLYPIIDGGVADDASSRGVDGTAGEAPSPIMGAFGQAD